MEILIRIYPDEILKEFPQYTPIYKIIKLLKAKRILEIGCYKGDFVRFLRKEGYEAYGIDPEVEENEFLIRGFYEEHKFEERFDLIFAKLVYSLRYCYERDIKPSKKTLEKMAREGRYILLIDDRGTIFPKSWLKGYFKILLYESSDSWRRMVQYNDFAEVKSLKEFLDSLMRILEKLFQILQMSKSQYILISLEFPSNRPFLALLVNVFYLFNLRWNLCIKTIISIPFSFKTSFIRYSFCNNFVKTQRQVT